MMTEKDSNPGRRKGAYVSPSIRGVHSLYTQGRVEPGMSCSAARGRRQKILSPTAVERPSPTDDNERER